MKKTLMYTLGLGFMLLISCELQTYDNPYNNTTSSETVEDVDNESSVSDALGNNKADHDDASDYTWDSSTENIITLNGTSITENCDGASASGSTLTISQAGNYKITGSLSDGQIIVNTEDEAIVRLILNGVDIHSETSAAIYIKKAEKVMVVAADNTTNSLSDATSYTYDNTEDEEPNATLFSKTDLTFYGEGTLYITGNFNDAINGKDGIIIASGNINITAEDDGIRGKDYLVIKAGTITIDAGGDGFKSDNDDDSDRGYISILSGDISISSKGDAMAAETDMLIQGGNFNLVTSGSVSSYNDVSTKAIKAGINIIIEGGTFDIVTTEDAIHSDQSLTISNGDFTISASDDGIHADYDLTINDGTFTVTKSYEALECGTGDMNINGGVFDLTASDDGVNLSGSGDSAGGGGGGNQGMWSTSSTSSSYTMYLNPESMIVNATGDGLDANGSIVASGGTIVVNGPTSSGNGAIDYDGSYKQNGGVLLAAGSSGMLQAPGTSSSQYTVVLSFRSSQSSGSIIHVESSDGSTLFTFKAKKSYQAIVFSSPDLQSGTSYVVYSGGSISGDAVSGLYLDGTYSVGSQVSSFTCSSKVTTKQIN